MVTNKEIDKLTASALSGRFPGAVRRSLRTPVGMLLRVVLPFQEDKNLLVPLPVDDRGTPAGFLRRNWMSTLADDAPLRQVAILRSHNAGAAGTTFFDTNVQLDFLNCQQGSVYDQLCCGVRWLDIRPFGYRGEAYCFHGTGKGQKLKDVIADIARFAGENEGEFICFSVGEPTAGSGFSADGIRYALAKELDIPALAFGKSRDVSTMTLGEMRQSGRRFLVTGSPAILSEPTWCRSNSSFRFDYNGASGEALYHHIYKTILPGSFGNGLFDLALHRTSTDHRHKTTPLRLVMEDRARVLELLSQVQKTPEWLAKINVISMDYVTFSHALCDAVLALNLHKGYVKPACAGMYKIIGS